MRAEKNFSPCEERRENLLFPLIPHSLESSRSRAPVFGASILEGMELRSSYVGDFGAVIVEAHPHAPTRCGDALYLRLPRWRQQRRIGFLGQRVFAVPSLDY